MVEGRDTREVDSHELLSHTAIVFQDFIQYALSAGDNIALGRHERAIDFAAIVRAAGLAGADRDIRGLPEGYETLLGSAFIDTVTGSSTAAMASSRSSIRLTKRPRRSC